MQQFYQNEPPALPKGFVQRSKPADIWAWRKHDQIYEGQDKPDRRLIVSYIIVYRPSKVSHRAN